MATQEGTDWTHQSNGMSDIHQLLGLESNEMDAGFTLTASGNITFPEAQDVGAFQSSGGFLTSSTSGISQSSFYPPTKRLNTGLNNSSSSAFSPLPLFTPSAVHSPGPSFGGLGTPPIVLPSIRDPNANASTNGAVYPQKRPLSPQMNGTYRDNSARDFARTAEPSSHMLQQIEAFYHKQVEDLQNIRNLQFKVMHAVSDEEFHKLNQMHEELKRNIDQQLQMLAHLGRSNIFAPNEVNKAFYLHQDLQTQSMQLELYHQELMSLKVPSNPPRCYIALVIIQQPFPAVLTKGRPTEEPVAVQLMTGAHVDIETISQLHVVVNMDSTQPKGTPSKNIENEQEDMDPNTKIAKFNIKFLNGTRKNLATLKFDMQVKLRGGAVIPVESNPSHPFVVITNECQFEESDGLLLRAESFQSSDTQVPWALFGNLLQRHFLRATRQDPVKPQRFLSRSELQYISAKFFGGNSNITIKMFDDFWAWFGKGLQKLRYQRHLCSMWQHGLIYGYVPRDTVNAALVNQDVGTFLIRLSESNPGTFAIGYVIDETDPEKRVRHYLITKDDVWAPKKTLPDFLADSPQFQKFLQINYEITGLEKHRIVDKELVLETYNAKKQPTDQPSSGYDHTLLH
ncbi:hypothetical protein PROFUN_03920 [Planoprotostelium fungivorum]|uniref:Signal transducer and activator of transcription n=1 Tax=Planoprotostelium fungivorum TaxID=1890364 RepID=A0A2P6MTS6_9EUKA|nr:hypothetical protein PROFUN_03920 [Planoprotostelium fungivorum]